MHWIIQEKRQPGEGWSGTKVDWEALIAPYAGRMTMVLAGTNVKRLTVEVDAATIAEFQRQNFRFDVFPSTSYTVA